MGEELLALTSSAEILHFAEAGMLGPDIQVDVAFVEGSISTPDEKERIQRVRAQSRFLVTIGACATSGGLQALRNGANVADWVTDVYAHPEHIATLDSATAVSAHVHVDLELWGCPVSVDQVRRVLRDLLAGVVPARQQGSVCIECKRQNAVCVMVTKGLPCMGAVTRGGCGAVCPRVGRDCYACYGPAELVNTESLSVRLAGLGLTDREIAHRFLCVHSEAPAFKEAGARAGGLGQKKGK
jgi:coenzyme F420-reducing hydrogenase gamma subunit